MNNLLNLDILELKCFLQSLGFKEEIEDEKVCADLIDCTIPYEIKIEINCSKSNKKLILTKFISTCTCLPIEAPIHDELNSDVTMELCKNPVLALSPSINSLIYELIQSAVNLSRGGTLSDKLKSKFAIRHKSVESLINDDHNKQEHPQILARYLTWDAPPSPPRSSSSPLMDFSLTPSSISISKCSDDNKDRLADIFKTIIKKAEEGCGLVKSKNNTYTKKRISDIPKPNDANATVNMGTFVNVKSVPVDNMKSSSSTYKRPLLTPKSSRIALLKKKKESTFSKSGTPSTPTPGTPKTLKNASTNRPDTPNPFNRIGTKIPAGAAGPCSPAGISKIKTSSRIPSIFSRK